MDYKTRFNNLSLSKLEKYKLGDALSINAELLTLNNISSTTVVHSLKQIIKQLFFIIYEYKYIMENSKLLFIYTDYFYRKDHYFTFDNLVKNMNHKDVLFANKLDKTKIDINSAFKTIPIILNWIKELKKSKFSYKEIIFLLPTLVSILKFDRILMGINPKRYNMMCVYYDVCPCDNIAVQWFNLNKIKTSTLQHGSFCARKEQAKVISDTGVELENSNADYFLAWNNFTKKEAIKAGMEKAKIIVLGMPKYINHNIDHEVCSGTAKHIFGVVLNGIDFEEENMKLIIMANQLARKINCKYVLKYHPNFIGNEYDSLVDKQCFFQFSASISEEYLSVNDYSKMVNFTIMTSSSVFVELVFLNHSVYRLICNSEDKYNSISVNSFKKIDDLYNLISNREFNKNNQEELFNHVCTVKDVKSRYEDFFYKWNYNA